jgi:MoaA/NifB/PqqE/SkfB family radical SAM enzyme
MLSHLVLINTLRCDLKCAHCLRGFPHERPDFPLELLDKLLTEALPFGANHVALTGGEPHLHPEFDALVDKIVAYGYTWHFVTNGQQTEPYLPLMEKYKNSFRRVSVSLDGAVASTHDEIRQRQGAFERAIASIKQYVQSGYVVKIGMTLNQKNKNEMEAMVNLARELGASSLGFGGTIPASWNQGLGLNDEEALRLWQKANELREETGFDIHTVSALHTRGGVNFCNILNFFKLTFNTKGEMIFCCDTIEHGAAIGSLAENSLAVLIEKWLGKSAALQAERARKIAQGRMKDGFDTCAICNGYFSYPTSQTNLLK